MINIAISIVNYGNSAFIESCLETLQKSISKASHIAVVEIWVVDNYCTEQDSLKLAEILSCYSNVTYILSKQNVGFAAGHNLALRKLFERSQDYVWILNSDCIIAEEALIELINKAQSKPNIKMWGATICDYNSSKIQCCGGYHYNPWLSIARPYKQMNTFKVESIVHDELPVLALDYIDGASMFFNAKALQDISYRRESSSEVEYLNEDFFLYFEELDLALRIGTANVGWCSRAIIHHYGGASSLTLGKPRNAIGEYHSTLSSLKFTYNFHKNKLITVLLTRLISKFFILVLSKDIRLYKWVVLACLDFRGVYKSIKMFKT